MRAIIFLMIILSFLLGCSEDYSNLPQISVDFKWPVANTGTISPELLLGNVPDQFATSAAVASKIQNLVSLWL